MRSGEDHRRQHRPASGPFDQDEGRQQAQSGEGRGDNGRTPPVLACGDDPVGGGCEPCDGEDLPGQIAAFASSR